MTDTELQQLRRELAGQINAGQLLLACTELPMVADPDDRRFVDPIRLVASELLDRASQQQPHGS